MLWSLRIDHLLPSAQPMYVILSQFKYTTLFFQLGYSLYFHVFRKRFCETFRNLKLASSEKEIIIY